MEIKPLEIKDRIINLFCEIDEESCQTAIEKIIEANVKDAQYINNVISGINSMGFEINFSYRNLPPIVLNLSTFGGEVYSGWGLCDAIRMSASPIRCMCYGKVMSMGIPILLSAAYKSAYKNTRFMIHDLSAIHFGKNENVKESLDEAMKLREMYADYICKYSKFPRKKLNEIFDKKIDYYFSAEEALKYKIIDEIIDDEEPEVEVKQSKKKDKDGNQD